MNHLTAILNDKDYIVDLLNGPCMPSNEKREHTPINPDWVGMEASASVTEAFHNLLPKGIPYQTCWPVLTGITPTAGRRRASWFVRPRRYSAR